MNGLGTVSGARAERILVSSGTVVTVGRTTLRFLDELAAVPPAIPLARDASVGAAVAPRWWQRPRAQVAIIVGGFALFALENWSTATERGAATGSLTTLLAIAVALAIWAGVWAVASRAVRGQFRFLPHVAIVMLGVVAQQLLSTMDAWGQFLLPAATFFAPVQSGLLLFILAAVVAGHLRVASHLSLVQRWRTGAVASGVVLALMGTFALLDDESYTPSAEFSGIIKTLHPTLVPTQGVEEFSATLVDLRSEVDSLLAKDARR